MSDSPFEGMQVFLEKAFAEQAKATETLAEMSVQSGLCGFSTWLWTDDGEIRFEGRVDPDVPYGQWLSYPFGTEPPPLREP